MTNASVLGENYRDEIGGVHYHEETTHHTGYLPIPDEGQEQEVEVKARMLTHPNTVRLCRNGPYRLLSRLLPQAPS